MKRYETRVLVEESEERIQYYAQYKTYYLWCIPCWNNFDPIWSPPNVAKAFCKVTYESGECTMSDKRIRERMCEVYHQLCDEQEAAERKEKLHRKTRKITSYKHP